VINGSDVVLCTLVGAASRELRNCGFGHGNGRNNRNGGGGGGAEGGQGGDGDGGSGDRYFDLVVIDECAQVATASAILLLQ
jgi:hypothetical protein